MTDHEFEIKKELWRRIEKYRTAKYWTNTRLARESGVNLRHILRMRNDNYRHLPTLPTLLALCNAFDIRLTDLFFGL